MRNITITLTLPEFNHIVALLLHNEDEGSYSGPVAQYWKRHHRIIKKLHEAEIND